MPTSKSPRLLLRDEVLAIIAPHDSNAKFSGNALLTQLTIRQVVEAFAAAGHDFNRQGIVVVRA